ncbi:MAG: MmgE/PrpD family protein [Candidatus Dormibacteraeota bacterium]|uniref:MmgE/PrpD family protein n=1 Tax=Candidatus Amunia macphersoniae TaxID=3127014 RepID=A0A934NJT6_9BACT|nr:MmgE/PrpD family protein [Candidatus Dormibacteraeota bacterium]
MTGEITRELARFVTETTELPPAVERAMRRMLLNMVSLSAGSSRHSAATAAARVVMAMDTAPRASVLGTSMRVDTQWAAFLNGVSGHVEDYDDTHLVTVMHPGPVVVPAALAVAEGRNATVAELLFAMALGTEVALRVGVGLGPAHFDRGWHVTGTLGVIGAAVAAARLAQLGTEEVIQALGLATTQAGAIRSALGTETKSFHCGHAAESGVEAAQLVELGFTAAVRGIEGRRGMAALMTEDADLDCMVAGLGERWELHANQEKPYACGVVSHPTLDAARRLRKRLADISAIAGVEVTVNPVVLDVMAIQDPATGLESKFSVYHCAAIGLLDGRGGPREFSDDRARAADVVSLRSRVSVTTDEHMPRDATRMVVRMRDGRSDEEFVDHIEVLDEERLAEKARSMLEQVLGPSADGAMTRLIGLRDSDSVISLVEAVTTTS